MKLTFATQSAAQQGNTALNPERLINCYSEPASPGARSSLIIKAVMGQAAFADLDTLFLRAMAEINGVLYVVAGAKLWRVSSAGVATELGAVADDEETTITGNGTAITVVANGTYFVYDGAMTSPTGGVVDNAGSVEFVDQYSIITEKNGNRFQWSDLADSTTLPGLNFATNESNNDSIRRVLVSGGNLWFLNERSLEIWYNTGAGAENAFTRISGGAVNVGSLGANLAIALDSGLFFIGNDGVCYMTAGAGLSPVSNPAIESNIKESTPTHCFYYEDGGRKFCVVRFSDRPAWCYDLTLRAWHERATGTGAWDVISTVQVYGKWYCGLVTGEIYEMSHTNTDVGQPLIRKMVGRPLYMEGKRFRVAEMEILARVGKSELTILEIVPDYLLDDQGAIITDDQGSPITTGTTESYAPRDAEMMLRVSKNGGHSFGAEKWRSLGDLGNYQTRTVWRSLGQYRQFTPEITISEPADISVYADANVRLA